MGIMGALFSIAVFGGILEGLIHIGPVAAFATAGVLSLGTVGFWVLLALSSVILFACLEYDEGAGATVTLFATLFLLQFFGDIKVFSYVRMYPLEIAKYLMGYFASGTLWCIAKWWFYVKNEKELYDEQKQEFLKKNKVEGAEIPTQLKAEWRISSSHSKPIVKQHKERVLRWMSFWPWSAVWTLVNDPIKKMFRAIYRHISGTLQKIADHIYQDVSADFAKNPFK